MSNNLRTRNGVPFNFVNGLKVRGVDIESLIPGIEGIPEAGTKYQFAGNGVQTAFTLPVTPYNKDAVEVHVKQLYVHSTDYTLVGDTVTFAEAPPAVVVGETYNVEIKVNLTTLNGYVNANRVSYEGENLDTILAKSKPLSNYSNLRSYAGAATQVRITDPGVDGFFYYDPADTTSADNGGTIIVSGTKRWKRLYSGAVNVKWFGAKGNGVDDDTAAFVTANSYLMTRPLLPSSQVIESNYVTMIIPEGIYPIRGHRIFGSQVPTGTDGTSPARIMNIIGQGASLMWEVVNEDDELFYFDGTIAAPKVEGLSIYPVRLNPITAGAGVIFRLYSNLSLNSQANASKLHLTDVTVWPGRYGTGASIQRAKYVFLNTGNAMCDQMLIENCRFFYFQKFWVGQNDQAVNITINSCSFYSLSNGNPVSSIFFDFTRMNDNFNVSDCSFSMHSGETLIKTRSPVSGGYYLESPAFNFNFDNNRIEIISSASNVSWNLCDMNFGKLNFRNSVLTAGGGSATVKTVARTYGHGNMNFENINFNTVDFYFPIATAETLNGSLMGYGAYLKNCRLLRTLTTYNWTDGVTNYPIKDVLVSNTYYWQNVRFEGCSYANGNGFYDWEFVNTSTGRQITHRKSHVVSYSQSGVAFGKEVLLPPYQTVKKITINMVGGVPDTYNTFRVWIGDRTLTNTYDVDNVRPDIRKNNYTLFEGNSTVFYADTSLQSVEVAFLNGGVEDNTILSEITVEYAPLDARSLNITTTSDQVKLYRSSRSSSSGTSAQRPDVDLFLNQQYFDTTLGKPIWWSGSAWKDAAGAIV